MFSDRIKKHWIGRAGLTLVPRKKGNLAVTLHNLKVDDFGWFEEFIDLINKKYGFLEPSSHGTQCYDTNSTNVLLTFDDGFRSNYLVAKDILQKYQVRALFFVTREFIGARGEQATLFAQKNFYPFRVLERDLVNEFDAMSWDEIGWLVEHGHTIGAHTDTHPKLSQLTPDDRHRQIIESADKMEQEIGQSITQFAYPFGNLDAVDENSVTIARNRFSRAFSNIRGMLKESPSQHFLYRQNIVPGMPMWMVEAVVKGRLDWKYHAVRKESTKRFWC